MRIAYEASAEYVWLFTYLNLENNVCGAMKDEHFDALERFWNDLVKNPEVVYGNIDAEIALILPRNCGWGMRHPDDRI